MTSHRRRKKRAQGLGLTAAEVELVRLLEEILDALRWNQVLGYGNQFLLNRHLDIDASERDRVMEAAAATVERDRRIQDWRARLRSVHEALAEIDRRLRGPGSPRTAERPGEPNSAREAEHEG